MARRFVILVALLLYTVPAAGQVSILASPSFTRKDTYYLKTPSKKSAGLICGVKSRKIVVGLLQSRTSTKVVYRSFVPKNSTERRILQKAESECATLRKRPACNDRRDNDLDGLMDYPLDPGCSSKSGTSEVDTTAPTAFQVFRKPFDGNFSLASLFDHQYPLEFVHTDNVIVNAYNEHASTTLGVDGHQGYDFVMDSDTPLYAAYDGVVDFAGTDDPFYCPLLNQTVTGNVVRLRHEIQGEQFYSIYAHLNSIQVTSGQSVSKGALLGLSGNTGCSTAPHLHFDIQRLTNVNGQTPASIDPFGWNSAETDPWSVHSSGTSSFKLWSPTEAPEPYRFLKYAPNPSPGDSAPVAITTVQFSGWLDSENLNNEFVELTLDDRYAPSTLSLTGYELSNLAGETYSFPSGFTIRSGHPVKIYTGAGTNSAEELYWGKSTPAWSNDGDCAQLKNASNFRIYYYYYGVQGCNGTSEINESTKSAHGMSPILDYNPARGKFSYDTVPR